MFLNKIRNIFCVADTKFVSATNVVRRANGETFVSATMCLRLPGLLRSLSFVEYSFLGKIFTSLSQYFSPPTCACTGELSAPAAKMLGSNLRWASIKPEGRGGEGRGGGGGVRD